MRYVGIKLLWRLNETWWAGDNGQTSRCKNIGALVKYDQRVSIWRFPIAVVLNGGVWPDVAC